MPRKQRKDVTAKNPNVGKTIAGVLSWGSDVQQRANA
jgi:hypothetical protein